MRTALVISNSNIKILALQGRQVKKWGSLALKAGLVRDGLILQPPAVAAAIDELFKSTRVRRERVAVSLAGLSFTYRFLALPRLKPASLEEAIMRAAKKEMSLPLEELYLAWQPVPGKGDEQSFFVLGVPRNLVDAAAQTLNVAGIEPYVLELHPLALARAANRRDVIVVSLEPDNFDIVFIADGIPVVIHTIGPRGEGATLEDNIRRLTDELTKTAAFHQSSHQESRLTPTTPLLLTGDLASEAPASGLLQTEVEYPVEPLSPPLEFPSGLPVASYAVSAGLALNDKSRKTASRTREGFFDININIFSGKYRKIRARALPSSRIWLGVFLAVAIILLFPLYQTINKLGAENTRLEEDLRRVSRELSLANLIAEETASIEKTIQEKLDTARSLETTNQSFIGDRGSYTRNLQTVTNAQPAGTFFTSLEIGPSRIIVRGETDSVFAAVNYALVLEALPFREVRISQLDEAAPKTVDTGEKQRAYPGSQVIVFEIIIDR
jgi:hypothetical protein